MFILIWRKFILWAVIGITIVLLWGYPSGGVPDWTEYYQQAQTSWQRGQTRQAISIWQQILKTTTNPDLRCRTLLNLTQAYLELGEIRRGRKAFEEAKSLSKTVPRS